MTRPARQARRLRLLDLFTGGQGAGVGYARAGFAVTTVDIALHPKHPEMGRAPRPGQFMHVVGNFIDAAAGRAAMGIDWMSRDDLREAIPPAYTTFLGEQLAAYLAPRVSGVGS